MISKGYNKLLENITLKLKTHMMININRPHTAKERMVQLKYNNSETQIIKGDCTKFFLTLQCFTLLHFPIFVSRGRQCANTHRAEWNMIPSFSPSKTNVSKSKPFRHFGIIQPGVMIVKKASDCKKFWQIKCCQQWLCL